MADTQATETPSREQGPTWGKADDYVISAFTPMLTLLEVAYHASESAIKPGPDFGPSFFELLEETLGRCMVRVSED